MAGEAYVPERGDEVEIVIRGKVTHFGGSNRILLVRMASGRKRVVHYNPHALIPTDPGETVTLITPVSQAAAS